jgi:hypothetical protein
MNARFWSTRNILIIIGIICEIVSGVTLFVGTIPSSEICPITSTIKKIYELPKTATRDEAIVALRRERESRVVTNDLTRSLAGVVNALGIIIFFVAWRAHRETRLHPG